MAEFSQDGEERGALHYELSEMRAAGEITAEEEATIKLRDAVNEDILSSGAKEGETKKKKKLSSRLSSSKAKTKELFEASRRENFEELSQPASSNHPTSMFPKPVIIEETTRRGSSKSSKSSQSSRKAPRPKGRSEVLGGIAGMQSHEEIGDELESEHAKKVALEMEAAIAKEKQWRREAREVPQYTDETAEGAQQSEDGDKDNELLRHLDASADETNIDKAMMAKEEGNDFFRSKNYDFALQQYSQAIRLCPRDGIFDTDKHTGCENAEHLAVFLGNRAAAFFMLEAWDQCEADCNLSLQLKPGYLKVLVRRCTCLERQERYEDALQDATMVQEEDPTFPKIDELVSRLKRAQDRKMEEMKEEAIGKLKDLGNNILGNFGMSLDQFKFNQNPDGTWSMGS